MAVRRVCVISVLGVLVLAGLAGVALAVPSRESAYKQALAGASATRILRSAFPTGRVTKLGGRTVRVLVADLAPTLVIEGQTPMTVAGAAHGATEMIPAHQRVQITPVISAGVVTGVTVTNIDAVPEQTVTMTGPIRLSTTTSLRLDKPGGLRFRGALEVRTGFNNTLMVINDVSAEAYDYGVLAGQIPATWGPKAQQAVVAGAIAVRSRAVASLRSASAAYDVTADNPLYLGIDGERATTTAAVVKSAGKVLVHNRKVMNVGFVESCRSRSRRAPARWTSSPTDPPRPSPARRPGRRRPPWRLPSRCSVTATSSVAILRPGSTVRA